MKAYLYYNGKDGSEASLATYEPLGAQTFRRPVIDLSKLKAKSYRNDAWKRMYQDALNKVEAGAAISMDKVEEYIREVSEEKALKEVEVSDNRDFYADDLVQGIQPVHLIRDDNIHESIPDYKERHKMQSAMIRLAFRNLFLPLMVLLLGVLSIIYILRMGQMDMLIMSFSAVLFASGIALLIKTLKECGGLLSKTYESRVDVLQNVITFRTQSAESKSKERTRQYYFADTNCFRGISISKSQYSKLKKLKGQKVGLVSYKDTLIIVNL